MRRILMNEQNRNQIITFAEKPGIEFHLSPKEIGRGASCIVYHAIASDNTEHLLKEYYPKHLDLDRDDSGQIIVPDRESARFEEGLLRFRRGCERQKSVRLSYEGLKNFTCNVQDYYRANGTEYIDMTCFEGRTYDHVQEQSVHDLMRRMRTLVLVLGNYHRAGLLHLDIKPENIYVRPEGETVEDVMLFDFDSVTPVRELFSTKVLSCTKTWAAPEQLLPEKRRNICAATDLFSIGEMIFVQLFGRHSTNAERRSYVTQYAYDHNAEIFKNMNPKIFPLLDELLCHTICGVVGNRYQSAYQLLSQIDLILYELSQSEPYLISNVPPVGVTVTEPSGRLQKIHAKLKYPGRHFCKSKSPDKIAQQYIQAYHGDYDTIICLSCGSGLVEMFEAFPIQNFTAKKPSPFNPLHKQIFDVLDRVCSERVLLIITNFHEGYLVDDRYFDLQEIIEVCRRLLTLDATILTIGSFDSRNFMTIHWQFYFNLLKQLATKCFEMERYWDAKYYGKLARKAAGNCDDPAQQLLECREFLEVVRVEKWMQTYPADDPEEDTLDEILFEWRTAEIGYGKKIW